MFKTYYGLIAPERPLNDPANFRSQITSGGDGTPDGNLFLMTADAEEAARQHSIAMKRATDKTAPKEAVRASISLGQSTLGEVGKRYSREEVRRLIDQISECMKDGIPPAA